jgi:polysaccharide biosynthesis/export protein
VKSLSVAVALLLIVTIPAPCAAADPAGGSGQNGYVIGPEDVLEIAVWNNTAVSRTVPVRPDGMISLPLLNDVRAAGLTPVQLRETVIKDLARYIATPEVSVIVREVNSLKVSVIGEVKTAGRFELRSVATVLDVLALAGGLTEYADSTRIVILRREGMSTKQIPFDFRRVTMSNGPDSPGSANIILRAGDIILVP